MTTSRDKLSMANKSYMMDVVKRKCLDENGNTISYQSTSDNEYQDVDTWKNDRLNRLREIQKNRREYLDRGSGNLQLLNDEKELIEIVKDNTRVLCHFYEDEFERCRILDELLISLASRFLDTKFVKIKASKSPFFTDKLSIKALPTLVAIVDGNIEKIFVGFQEFSGDNINLDTLRNTLLKNNILTDRCCIIDANSDEEE